MKSKKKKKKGKKKDELIHCAKAQCDVHRLNMAKQVMHSRQPIITVLGHTDHGKTKLLDAIRGTAIAEKEAGGITQHIGATEVPISTINTLAGSLMKKFGFQAKIPGLLFIDTPGHEAFTNLRTRGGSIADMAILVIDINQKCQPQTFEAIDILKSFKVPFVIALTKIDLIRGWNTDEKQVSVSLEKQNATALQEMDNKLYEIVAQVYSKGLQSDRFDRVNDFTKCAPIIPISAKKEQGLPELLAFLTGLSQKYLEKRLMIEENSPGKATILEVKEEKGLGTTIDIILYDGTIKVGNEIVLGSKNQSVIKTKVRSLLKPKPLNEIRQPDEKFEQVKEVSAASGIKLVAAGLDGALSGSPLRVIETGLEEQEVINEIQSLKIETNEIGPIVKADTLGALEAIEKMLKNKEIQLRKADIGEITKKDLIEAASIKEQDKLKAVIFAFNINVSPEIQKEADLQGTKIFSSNVIYKIIEDYDAWIKEQKLAEKQSVLKEVSYPVKLEILPGCVFRNCKPAIVGVRVVEGLLRNNIRLICNNKVIGQVKAVQDKGKTLEQAKKNQEVAISIEKAVVGKSINENDIMYSYVSEEDATQLINLSVLNFEELELLNEIKEKIAKLKSMEVDNDEICD